MGSQYIRGTTYLKTRHKKNKGGIPNRILGYLPIFQANLWSIYKREWQVFHRILHIFHNGRGGWIKVERNGEKWREDNGIMVRIRGYENWDIRQELKSILRALETILNVRLKDNV